MKKISPKNATFLLIFSAMFLWFIQPVRLIAQSAPRTNISLNGTWDFELNLPIGYGTMAATRAL
jgi:hypothetical protein